MADLGSSAFPSQLSDSMEQNADANTLTLQPVFPNENDTLDDLNDETFGSVALDDEWDDSAGDLILGSNSSEFEKWREEQKQLFGEKKVPLDEAPPRGGPENEEKMAEAISKLGSIELDHANKEEFAEPLPNADAIEAIWTTSPKHSSNIRTPDSPYLQDLLSPTHNIWGSPTNEERQDTNDGTRDSDEHSRESHNERRALFSPVLEDEAIVSALPKRIPKPIRMEDMAKIDFGPQITPQPLRAFPNGFPRVRPPPGFSPNPAMGSYPVHPPPPGPRSYNAMFPGQLPPMSPGQAQAYYAAMMKQRMAMIPPYCRTPTQPFPQRLYHSDPGHLRHRGPNIPQHHARFITPNQYRNWANHNTVSGPRDRSARDNSRRRLPQHYIDSPKYRPQYYIGSEDEDEVEDSALMTAKEKDWLIRIQLMQLTTDKPELDDYYFHTFERRRLAKEKATQGDGDVGQPDKDAEMSLPHVTKGEYHYRPLKFEGSLGQVSIGSVLHPREVVQVGQSGRPKGLVGSLKETKKKYQLLMTIEKGFDYVLPIEDLERMALQMPEDVRPQLYERRDKLFQRCYDLLGLNSSNDSNKKYNDETLLQMLAVRKGRRLLSKMLRILKQAQRHDIALAVTRNLRALTKKDVYNENGDNLSAAMAAIIKNSPCEKLLGHYNNIVGEHDSSILHLLSSKFTLQIVIELMKRISVVAENIDEESAPLQTIWPTFLSLAIRDFVTASPKALAKNYQEIGKLVDFFNDNAEQTKTSLIQEHYRLVENACVTSPPR